MARRRPVLLLLLALVSAGAAQPAASVWRLREHGLLVVNASLADGNKYRLVDAVGAPVADAEGSARQSCHLDVYTLWSNDVGSSVISSPIVVPTTSFEHEGKHVATAAYHEFVELLDGIDGHPSTGSFCFWGLNAI